MKILTMLLGCPSIWWLNFLGKQARGLIKEKKGPKNNKRTENIKEFPYERRFWVSKWGEAKPSEQSKDGEREKARKAFHFSETN